MGRPLQEIYKDLKDEFGVPQVKLKMLLVHLVLLKKIMEDTHWAVDKYSLKNILKVQRSELCEKLLMIQNLQRRLGFPRKNALDKEFVRQVKQTDQIAYELRKALVSISDAASLKNYSPKEHFGKEMKF